MTRADVLERRAKVAEMTRAGLSGDCIAAVLGVSERSVERARVATGCARPASVPLTEAELAAARQLLDDGASYAEVARTLGRGETTVARRFPGRGWTKSQGAQWWQSIKKELEYACA